MRWLTLLAATLLLAGCGTNDTLQTVDLVPAAEGNVTTAVHIATATARAQQVQKNGAKPGDATVGELITDLQSAQASTQQVQAALVLAQQQATTQAQQDADLKAQHIADQAAVGRRNLLLLVALFVGALVFYSGEWVKLSSPYTALLPNVVAGMLTVMVFAVLSAVVITLWSTFGWLIHFL